MRSILDEECAGPTQLDIHDVVSRHPLNLARLLVGFKNRELLHARLGERNGLDSLEMRWVLEKGGTQWQRYAGILQGRGGRHGRRLEECD